MRLIRGDGRVIEYALAPHNLGIKPSAAPGKQQSPEESDKEQSSGHPYGDSHRYRAISATMMRAGRGALQPRPPNTSIAG